MGPAVGRITDQATTRRCTASARVWANSVATELLDDGVLSLAGNTLADEGTRGGATLRPRRHGRLWISHGVD
jgi:hypothetical protein